MPEKLTFSDKAKSLEKKRINTRPGCTIRNGSEGERNGCKEMDLTTTRVEPPPLPACEKCQIIEKTQGRLINAYVELLSSVKEEFIADQLSHCADEDMWIAALRKLQAQPSESVYWLPDQVAQEEYETEP